MWGLDDSPDNHSQTIMTNWGSGLISHGKPMVSMREQVWTNTIFQSWMEYRMMT